MKMSNVDMWSMIVGFFIVPILAILEQPKWSKAARSLLMFVVSIIVALGTLYFAGTLKFDSSDSKQIITSILLVMVTAIATYKGFWQPTTIAPKIEAITSSPFTTKSGN